jgi:hypothetical protein
MRHRARHFKVAWRCPGPRRNSAPNEGKFARDETLRRHLLFPRFARCKDAVKQLLGLKSISSSGNMDWMIPLREGLERPWEGAEVHLTDLDTVKERLRDPHAAASSSRLAVPSIKSRRY